MIKATIRIFSLLLFIPLSASAQKYGAALGVRFGNNHYGISAQQQLLRRTTVEGIFSAYPSEYTSTLLLEQHFPLLGKGFNIYAGAGMHAGRQKENGSFYGYDGILGAEMKLPGLPLVISADVKPAYHINHTDWFSFSTALSARYIITKDTRKKRQKVREKRKRRRARNKRKEERKQAE